MKVSQIFTAPNQLTLLRMIFVPFIVIHLVEGRYLWALVVFVIAGFSDGLDGLSSSRDSRHRVDSVPVFYELPRRPATIGAAAPPNAAAIRANRQ